MNVYLDSKRIFNSFNIYTLSHSYISFILTISLSPINIIEIWFENHSPVKKFKCYRLAKLDKNWNNWLKPIQTSKTEPTVIFLISLQFRSWNPKSNITGQIMLKIYIYATYIYYYRYKYMYIQIHKHVVDN